MKSNEQGKPGKKVCRQRRRRLRRQSNGRGRERHASVREVVRHLVGNWSEELEKTFRMLGFIQRFHRFSLHMKNNNPWDKRYRDILDKRSTGTRAKWSQYPIYLLTNSHKAIRLQY